MSENPRIDTAVGNKVAQFRSKGTIKQAAFMLWSHDCQRWQMMGYDNNIDITALDGVKSAPQAYIYVNDPLKDLCDKFNIKGV